MSQSAPPHLIITGTVHHSRPISAIAGDVCIHPGANRTRYIDGYVYDGRQWRKLSLTSFGSVARLFDEGAEIGPLMRSIEGVLVRHKGMPIYYARPGKVSSYVFQGAPFQSFLTGPGRF